MSHSSTIPVLRVQNVFEHLLSRRWWRSSIALAFAFAPFCVLCAFGMTIANVLMIFGSEQMNALTELRQSNLENINVSEVLSRFSIILLCAGSAILFSLWSLSVWLLRLTAFASVAIRSRGKAQPAVLREAIKSTKMRAKYLMRLWFVASLYTLLPAIPLSILIAVDVLAHSSVPPVSTGGNLTATMTGNDFQALSGVEADQLSSLPLNLSLPPELAGSIHHWCLIAIAVLSTVILGYVLVTLVIAATTQAPAGRTASVALWQFTRQALPCCLLTAAVLAVNLVVGAPVLTLSTITGVHCHNIALLLGEQIWFGALSTVLWPLSVLPYCQMVSLSSPVVSVPGASID